MLGTTIHAAVGVSAFVVIAHGTLITFSIDEDAFDRWVADEGDELAQRLPDPNEADPGAALSELVYRALSAGVLIGDPGLELNIHDAMTADEPGYVVRLNNHTGRQQLVSLTRGWHELRWPPNDLTPSEDVRHHLQEICCIANALLGDLLASPT